MRVFRTPQEDAEVRLASSAHLPSAQLQPWVQDPSNIGSRGRGEGGY